MFAIFIVVLFLCWVFFLFMLAISDRNLSWTLSEGKHNKDSSIAVTVARVLARRQRICNNSRQLVCVGGRFQEIYWDEIVPFWGRTSNTFLQKLAKSAFSQLESGPQFLASCKLSRPKLIVFAWAFSLLGPGADVVYQFPSFACSTTIDNMYVLDWEYMSQETHNAIHIQDTFSVCSRKVLSMNGDTFHKIVTNTSAVSSTMSGWYSAFTKLRDTSGSIVPYFIMIFLFTR